MEFLKTSNFYSLNKLTYVKLRWIAYAGQLIAIFFVQFVLDAKFSYFNCILIILISILTNFYLQFRIKKNQLNNKVSTIFLIFDIAQLGLLFFFNWWNY
tara:strand:+ start:686 stop:982 length:297 start_codon:yes stop_codon:yes gene_type:complete